MAWHVLVTLRVVPMKQAMFTAAPSQRFRLAMLSSQAPSLVPCSMCKVTRYKALGMPPDSHPSVARAAWLIGGRLQAAAATA